MADHAGGADGATEDVGGFVKLIRCGSAVVSIVRCLGMCLTSPSTGVLAVCCAATTYDVCRWSSSDDFEFVVERRFAMVSGTIKAMLTGNFSESKGEARFPEIRGEVLERVVQYFHHKLKYHNSRVPIPDFPVPPELSLDMLLAANFLDC